MSAIESSPHNAEDIDLTHKDTDDRPGYNFLQFNALIYLIEVHRPQKLKD